MDMTSASAAHMRNDSNGLSDQHHLYQQIANESKKWLRDSLRGLVLRVVASLGLPSLASMPCLHRGIGLVSGRRGIFALNTSLGHDVRLPVAGRQNLAMMNNVRKMRKL